MKSSQVWTPLRGRTTSGQPLPGSLHTVHRLRETGFAAGSGKPSHKKRATQISRKQPKFNSITEQQTTVGKVLARIWLS